MAEFYAQQKPLVPFYGGSSNINKKSADEKIDQRMKEVGQKTVTKRRNIIKRNA